jgi:hypothetical protein
MRGRRQIQGGRLFWLLRSSASALLLSCATSQAPAVDFMSPPPDYGAENYPEVYERWTRHQKVLHELESALEVWATYKSRDYREAFVARYADAYRLSDAERQRIRSAQRDAETSAYEFVVTAQSAIYRWNDLDKKSSAWRISLRDGTGHELAPEKVTYEKLPEMYEREFFPVKTPFTRNYTVRFARPAPTADGHPAADDGFVGERSGELVLRIAGPFGAADLTWSAHP